MSKAALARFEAEVAARKVAEADIRTKQEKKKALREAVKEVIPKSVLMPKRPRGKGPAAGIRRSEVAAFREESKEFLDGIDGFHKYERRVRETALTMILIDGLQGTEPWRSKGPHAGAIAANARVRYLDNALRVMEDMRASLKLEEGGNKLLKGADVFDAEIMGKPD